MSVIFLEISLNICAYALSYVLLQNLQFMFSLYVLS